MTLLYTLERLMTEQAIIERDQGAYDAYGADGEPDFQYLSTVPCRFWWDRSTGARSANRTYVSPAREVPVSDGGLLVPSGTDVTERDRITSIQSFNPQTGKWVTYIQGLFTVTAVLTEDDHMELNLTRARLGA